MAVLLAQTVGSCAWHLGLGPGCLQCALWYMSFQGRQWGAEKVGEQVTHFVRESERKVPESQLEPALWLSSDWAGSTGVGQSTGFGHMQLGLATTGASYGYGFSWKLAEPTKTLTQLLLLVRTPLIVLHFHRWTLDLSFFLTYLPITIQLL